MYRIRLASLRTLSIILLAGFLVQSARAELVKFGQATNTSLSVAPVYAAIKLGFFAEEGIEIEDLNFQGASILLPQIANKGVTIGFPGPDPLILSSQPGRSLMPVKFFYNAARQSPWEFLVRQDSPIKSLQDIRGKTIGVGALANANVPITRAMLKAIGLETPRDYSFVAVGVGAPAFRALLNKDVDVYNTFDTNVAAFQNTGAKLRILPQEAKYRSLFSNGFATHVDLIKEKPALLAGFGRAFTKGLVVCEANPHFCVKNFYEFVPSAKPAGSTSEQALEFGLHILQAKLATYLAFPLGAPRNFGEYEEKTWRDFAKALHEGGELSIADIDVSRLFTNQFVSEFSNFDKNQVAEQARKLK